MPRPPTDAELDAITKTAIPVLRYLGDKAFELPDDQSCHFDRGRAPWIAWVDYLADETATELSRQRLNLCSAHADLFHVRHQRRELLHKQRPVVKLTLTQRP
jgi:hypothetical protein